MIDVTIQLIIQFFEIKINNNIFVNTSKSRMIVVIMNLNQKKFFEFF